MQTIKPTGKTDPPRLKPVIPSYGIDFKQEAEACRRIRAETAPVLKIDNI